jgi:hypothetical protein
MLLRCLVASSDGPERTVDRAVVPNLTSKYVITLPGGDRHTYWTGHDTVQSRYKPRNLSNIGTGPTARYRISYRQG